MIIQKNISTRDRQPYSKAIACGTVALLSALAVDAIAPNKAAAEPLADQTINLPVIEPIESIEPTEPTEPREPSVLLAQQESETPEPFGKAGTQRLYVQGAVASDFDDETLGLVGVGASHFFYDNHSVNLELNALAFDQPGDNAVGANLNFLVRSHWIRGENWSLYIDGGAGIIGTTSEVPSEGSSFNFTPQIGGGATFKINDKQRLMTGLRYYHISNADTFESNPGLDALMGYVGLNFPL